MAIPAADSTMTEISERSSLVSGLKNQEPQALQKVLEFALNAARQWSRLHNISPDEADDLVQETILLLLRKASEEGLPGAVQSDEQLLAFLVAVLRNRLLESYRSSQRSSQRSSGADLASLQIADMHEGPDEHLSAIQTEEQMKKALAQLSVSDREIITQRYIESKSIDEIANQLGISPGSARVRIHRILQHVRRLIATVKSEKR
jgi:RNA polymerase sigma factor (sigma-70 family)